ncbi:serine/threonine-protein phosphatase 7 long form homolog [Bidens hawaiensis]|uniref:serine/threonine-protein phosphatase 7 long form homolog n=1 Tax=Bidens hawaiensis TaxID=980011 RepID=UPI00404968E2
MNSNLHLNPGPSDDTLLYLGAEHRVRKLTLLNPREGAISTLDFKWGDGTFWVRAMEGGIRLEGRVLGYIDSFGFGGIVRCGYRKVDQALVVERWRPEMNTFHLPFGKTTATLEDVNVLWGLPIEGEALAGFEESSDYNERRHMCYTYLGFNTKESDYKNQFLKLKCIVDFMLENPIYEDSTDIECIQRARCICLIVASINMLADTNNAYASLHLLSHLKDPQVSGRLS